MDYFKTNDVVSEVGHQLDGKRGIVIGQHWDKRQLYIDVRWENGIETSERPGRLNKIGGW